MSVAEVEEESTTIRHKNKQTNAREANRPTLSSKSEVTFLRNRTEKHESKEQ